MRRGSPGPHGPAIQVALTLPQPDEAGGVFRLRAGQENLAASRSRQRIKQRDTRSGIAVPNLPQVVVGAVQEVDIVANFGAHANRTGKSLKAASWVHRKLRAAIAESDRVGKSCGRVVVGDAEIFKSDFSGHKDTEGPRSRLEFRTKKPCSVRSFVFTSSVEIPLL